MFNPPIIKPKGYAYGGPIGIGVGNIVEDTLVTDPIIERSNANEIQKDLESLSNDLKKVASNNKKPKKETKKNKEKKEFDDMEDFRDWIKTNTETDNDTGEVFFIQPRTGEKIPVDSSPEGNVLLYEVFKEQTGRTGEALDAIVDMDIKQFQQAPKGVVNSDFSKELKKVREEKNIGDAEAMAAYSAVPFDGSVVGTVQKRMSMSDLARSQAEEESAKGKQFLAYRVPGENTYKLTPEPVSIEEISQLGYEFAPPEMAEENFTQRAILAGRIPIGGEGISEKEKLQNQLLQTKIAKNIQDLSEGPDADPLMQKQILKVKLPGLYSRGSQDNLQFQVRLREDKKGNVKYEPDVDIAPIIRDIYKAEEYSRDTLDEINMVKELISADTVGLSQRVNDLSRGISALAGIDRTAFDPVTGRQLIPTPEILARWAKRFTAQNITILLGESNRTISDADRKRADDIVNILGTFTDVASAKASLEELVKIFEKPSYNANTALQSLYSMAETSPGGGYLDEIERVERKVAERIAKSGGKLTIPKSSIVNFNEISPGGRTAVSRTIDLRQ
tara:strand:+ start:21222 stop:22904 length:1683 start_codon:yes stop_codon:yes gene_type:complete